MFHQARYKIKAFTVNYSHMRKFNQSLLTIKPPTRPTINNEQLRFFFLFNKLFLQSIQTSIIFYRGMR